MFSDEYLSKLKDVFSHMLVDYEDGNCSVKRDRMKFFLWELNFLDIFLGLQRFACADGFSMLDDLTQTMQDIWKRWRTSITTPEQLNSYLEEFIFTSQRDKFIDPNTDPFTFHIPTEIWKAKLEFRPKYSFPILSSIPLPVNKDNDIPTPKYVMEFVDGVAQNLNVVLQMDDPCSLLFVRGSKEQLEEVLKELNLLKFFVCYVSNKCIEPQSQRTFLTHVLTVASQVATVAWLYLPIHGKEDQDVAPSEMNALLSHLLQMKIKPIKPGIRKIYIDVLHALKSAIQPGWHPNSQNRHVADYNGSVETSTHNLMELPTATDPGGVVIVDSQMEILQEMLKLLRSNLIHLPILDLDFHLQEMDTVIIDAGLLIYSLCDSEREEEDTKLVHMNRALGLNLPSNIQPIKAMIYIIIRKTFQSNLPRVHGLGYVDILLSNLKEFHCHYADSLASVKNQLLIIQKELQCLQPFIEAATKKQHSKLGTLQHCATHLISKAYEVEYVVDACISKEIPHWCLEHWILDIIKEITRIKAEIHENKMVEDRMNAGTAHMSSNSTRSQTMNEDIVGFEDVIEKLRDQLIKGTRGRDVISIVGMPGLGKTTLAYSLYSDRLVVAYFDIRAQCSVSRVYSCKDLLLAILCDAIGEDSRHIHVDKGADELAVELRKTLYSKRYLILIDDVWESSVWDDLVCCFYDANNGSRIILTTRNLEVANYARFESNPLQLRMFNDDESWRLLEKKVFGEETCPPLLKSIGQQIAEKCGQLPLSVVLVAGILAEIEKKAECWEQVANNLGPHIHSDSKAVVELSYLDLPCHLKPCFLYFGAFLEDREINVLNLTKLWISEGFIKRCEEKSLDDIAQGYFDNLIGRNLVMVGRPWGDVDGKFDACRIHDVLLDFCKLRAAEEKFLLWIKRDQNVNLSSCGYTKKPHAQRRMAFSEMHNLEKWSSSCSLVGSVIFKNNKEFSARHDLSSQTWAISCILKNFKFLKVLELEHCVVIDSFPTELVYLRYFSAEINQESIPSSIANLWNLQTLVLRPRGQISLPVTLWKMTKLRQLYIGQSFTINGAEELPDESSTLHDLDTLSIPYFSCVEDAELMFRKTPNIREMRCKFKGASSLPFPVLDFPPQLERLSIFGHQYPVCISGPKLKGLRVSGFCLARENLLNFGQLQNIRVLQLLSVEFDDEKWEVDSDEFPQLKVLNIAICNSFKEWTVSDDAFPNLERLFLCRCYYLKEIPSSFGDISSLKSIEVQECNESVVTSAKVIRETQVEDYQNNGFELFIRDANSG